MGRLTFGLPLARRLYLSCLTALILALLALGAIPVTASAAGIGQVGGNVYVPIGGTVPSLQLLGGSATVNGTVAGDARVVGGTLRVNGLIRGTVQVVGGHLWVGPHGRILGPVQLVGSPLSMVPGAYLPQAPPTAGPLPLGWHGHLFRISPLVSALGNWLGSLLLALLLLALFPRALASEATELRNHPGLALAVGFTGLIGGGLLAVLFAITLVGIPFALGLVFLLMVAGLFGVSAVQLAVGSGIMTRLGRPTLHPFWPIALGSLLIQILGLAPGIGGAVRLLIVVLAVGASIYSSFGTGWRPNLGPLKQPGA